MSREDDFDDIMDSPDTNDIGQDDTSEPLLEDESFDESSVSESGPEPEQVTLFTNEAAVIEITPTQPAARKPPVKKKKKVAVKTTAKKKKVAKPARKPAAKKTTAKKKTKKPAKKTAKKKTRPVAKKKKATKKKRSRR